MASAQLLLSRRDDSLGPGLIVFLLLMLTLLVTMYDRFRPVYEIRFSIYTPGWGAAGQAAPSPAKMRFSLRHPVQEPLMLVSSLPRPVGFVLGGGGSLGAVQVGMLQALSEHSVFPDVVVGTSVGALNGAVVALDPRGAANRLSHLWPKLTRQMVFPGGPLAQVRTLQKQHTHLFPNDGLAAIIAGYLGDKNDFDDLTVPLGAVTLDVATGAPYVIRTGRLLPALLASAAIPGIFPSVTIDARRLYDGGVVANVPITQALAMGARSLVVLDATFPGRLPAAPENLAEAVLFTTMLSMRVQAQLEAPRAAERVPVLYVPGPAIHHLSPFEFGHTAMLIEGSYEAARTFLETVQVDGPGLYGSPSGP